MKSNQVAKLSQLFITKQALSSVFLRKNPVKVTIFNKEYFLNWASIHTVWDSEYIPEAILKVSFVTILKSGSAGEKYDKREFSLSDIGKYIVGEEETFKSIFKQHAKTVQSVIQEKAVA